nr:VPg [Apple latent spherical virus]
GPEDSPGFENARKTAGVKVHFVKTSFQPSDWKGINVKPSGFNWGDVADDDDAIPLWGQ